MTIKTLYLTEKDMTSRWAWQPPSRRGIGLFWISVKLDSNTGSPYDLVQLTLPQLEWDDKIFAVRNKLVNPYGVHLELTPLSEVIRDIQKKL